jgi:hypothetical protein
LIQLDHENIIKIYWIYEIDDEKEYKNYTKMQYVNKSLTYLIENEIWLKFDQIK